MKIKGLLKVSSIPIQVVGVYSFKVKTAPHSLPMMSKNEVKLASGLIVNVVI